MTFYNGSAVSKAEQTFCPSGCDATTTLSTAALVPGAMIVTATAAARALQLDAFKWQATGLSR
jgi:hypothetical protein